MVVKRESLPHLEQQRGECETGVQVSRARKKSLVFKARDEAKNSQPSSRTFKKGISWKRRGKILQEPGYLL